MGEIAVPVNSNFTVLILQVKDDVYSKHKKLIVVINAKETSFETAINYLVNPVIAEFVEWALPSVSLDDCIVSFREIVL